MKLIFKNVCSKSQVVDDSICLELAGTKPATISECNIGVICPEWHVGVWQPVILFKQTFFRVIIFSYTNFSVPSCAVKALKNVK